MSALWSEFHISKGLTMTDFLAGHEGFKVAAFSVGFVRRLGLGVVADPTEEFKAHVLVNGKKTGSIKKSFDRESSLDHGLEKFLFEWKQANRL
jgi:hypothetical protein